MRKKSTSPHIFVYISEHVFAVLMLLVVAAGASLLSVSQGGDANHIVDRMPPSEPELYLASVLPTAISLRWEGARDNIAIAGYQLFRNGRLVAEPKESSFVDATKFDPGTVVEYAVAAVDLAGNVSLPSSTTIVVVPEASSSSEVLPSEAVSFSVTLAPVSECVDGISMREVFFAMVPPDGGSLVLHASSSPDRTLEWGRVSLPAGSYSWTGRANTGFRVEGENSGSLTILNECASSSAHSLVTPGSAAQGDSSDRGGELSSTIVSPAQPSLKLFVDNTPISPTSRIPSGETLELRVNVSHAKKVNFYAMTDERSAPLDLGPGVYDDLLSFDGAEVWAFMWKTLPVTPQTYRIYARILSSSGEILETAHIPVTLVGSTAEQSLTPRFSAKGTDVNTLLHVELPDPSPQTASTTISPRTCVNAEQCKAYCEQGASTMASCLSFVRDSVDEGTTDGSSSIAAHVITSRLTQLLEDLVRRPKDIPEYVTDARDFNVFCGSSGNKDICERVLLRADLATKEMIASSSARVAAHETSLQKIFTERIGVRPFIDSDGDGICDFDEVNIYHTDPNRRDSDGDGFLDGVELLSHTDPLGHTSALPDTTETTASSPVLAPEESTPSEQVTLIDPRMKAVFLPELLRVSRIEPVVLNSDDVERSRALSFSGTAPANSYVTLFLFSEPLAFSAKTTSSGEWSVIVDKELPPGDHQAILTINNAQGDILARSESLSFSKDTQGLIVAPGAFSDARVNMRTSPVAIIALILAFAGIAFSVFGVFLRRRHHLPGAKVVRQQHI